MMNKKYVEFCKKEPIPIFSQYWWLDTVCGKDNWDVLLYEKGGQIWASFPYCIKRRYGLTLITMPKLTPVLGPYIKYPERQKYYRRLSWEKEIMNYFIENLSRFDYFNINFHYSITNWLPFASIKFALEINKNFDFEGSMIESIEKYFRSFGAIQKPYFNIFKIKSKILKFIYCFKKL